MNDKLSYRQMRVLSLLFVSRSITAALEKAGVKSRKTFYRWLKQPEFKAALEQERERVFQQNRVKIEKLFSSAIDRLNEILASDDESQARLAAEGIIRNVLKIKELDVSEKIDNFMFKLEELAE